MEGFDFRPAERKWQKRWEEARVFEAKEDPKKKKFYVLEMLPYPSAAGLHMGHIRNYTMGDAYARFKRMHGFNVLYPMGYDAFGLPAENAAIKNKTRPKEYTEKAIAGIKKNQKSLGLSYDWTREIATCYPEYYRWNQWFFLQMLKKGIAYKKEAPVNWCPKCETVLANEQVEDGKCWRCDSEVVEKSIEQWFFAITKYADRLLEGLEKLEGWPEKIKAMQRNWIGKSEGVNFREKVKDMGIEFEVYDSIPQTYVAQTFTVIAPEHPLVRELVKGTKHEKPVMEFVERIMKKKAENRFDIENDMEGIFTGRYVQNPFGKGDLPIWVASYVLAEYGTGIVNCSAHDMRDFAFAKKYGIPLRIAMLPKDHTQAEKVKRLEFCYHEDPEGIIEEPEEFKGMTWAESREPIIKYIEKMKYGKSAVHYKIRDWGISRQRYWGTPIPVVYCKKCGMVPVPEKDLPVLLPEDVEFTGHGNPLEKHDKFVNANCPKCGGKARRETDTMDTFVDSSWYFLRYCSPKSKEFAFDKDAVRYWMPVDQYIGGAEHAVMHLLYARFFTKVLRDMGLVGFSEPFTRLFNQGIVYKDGHKMSKSFGNAVTQEEIADRYGIDTARLFLLFVASPDSQLEWSEKGIQGTYRFLTRFYRWVDENREKIKSGQHEPAKLVERILEMKLHATIKRASTEIEGFQFNLAISCIMEFVNDLYKYADVGINEKLLGECVRKTVQILSVFAPHTAEELWEKTGGMSFVSVSEWPQFDEKKITDKLMESENAINCTIEDVKNILKIVTQGNGMVKKAFLYVIPPDYEMFMEARMVVARECGLDVSVFALNDKNMYDPKGKAKKAKPGRPAIYLE